MLWTFGIFSVHQHILTLWSQNYIKYPLVFLKIYLKIVCLRACQSFWWFLSVWLHKIIIYIYNLSYFVEKNNILIKCIQVKRLLNGLKYPIFITTSTSFVLFDSLDMISLAWSRLDWTAYVRYSSTSSKSMYLLCDYVII